MARIARNVNNTYGAPRGNAGNGMVVYDLNYGRILRKLKNSIDVLVADSRRGWTNTNADYMDGSYYLNEGNGSMLSDASTSKCLSLRHNSKFNAAFPDGSASSKGVEWITNSASYDYVLK